MNRIGIFRLCLPFWILLLSVQTGCAGEETSQTTYLPQGELTILTMEENQEHIFNITFAETSEAQARGLMFVEDLPQDAGMLFVFDTPRERSFWMKNTFIPLDIIFIDTDRQIHHIHHEAQPHDLTGILSNGAVPYVLEINGGLAQELGLQSGDRVFWRRK